MNGLEYAGEHPVNPTPVTDELGARRARIASLEQTQEVIKALDVPLRISSTPEQSQHNADVIPLTPSRSFVLDSIKHSRR